LFCSLLYPTSSILTGWITTVASVWVSVGFVNGKPIPWTENSLVSTLLVSIPTLTTSPLTFSNLLVKVVVTPLI
jgi:hypothetical protein